MRRTALLALLLLVMLSESCTGGGYIVKKPLYEDPAGWSIWTASNGEEIVYHYYRGILDRMPEPARANLPDDFGGALEEMELEGAWRYWGLVLLVPEGVKTYWTIESRVALLYWEDGKLQESMSTQLFLIQRCDLQAVDLWETGSFSIPAPYDIFETPREYPVLFARFELESVPDTLVSCNVYGVLSKQ